MNLLNELHPAELLQDPDHVNFNILSSIIIDIGTPLLRDLWKIRWAHQFAEDWIEDYDYDILRQNSQAGLKLMNDQWLLLRSGKSMSWDISLISSLLLYSSPLNQFRDRQEVKTAIIRIQKARNMIAHKEIARLSDDKFIWTFRSLKECFIKIGSSIETIRAHPSSYPYILSWEKENIERKMDELHEIKGHNEKLSELDRELTEIRHQWDQLYTPGNVLQLQLNEKFSIPADDNIEGDIDQSIPGSEGVNSVDSFPYSASFGSGTFMTGFRIEFSPEHANIGPFNHVPKVIIGDRYKINEELQNETIRETSTQKYIGIERINLTVQPELSLEHVQLTFDAVQGTCKAMVPIDPMNSNSTSTRFKFYRKGIRGKEKAPAEKKKPGDEFDIENGSEIFLWGNDTMQQVIRLIIEAPISEGSDGASPTLAVHVFESTP
jgi:hypothetical protein